LVLDTDIHDGLGKERQHQLQGAARKQSQDYPEECLAVFLEISEKELEGTLLLVVFLALHLIGKECRGGFQEHSYSLVLAIRFRAYPMLLELI